MERLTKTNFAQNAEKVIKQLVITDQKGNQKLKLTTSKIRNLLSMTNALYNQGIRSKSEKLDADTIHDIQYLKMRFAYECGRENSVKEFVDKAEIMRHIDGISNRQELLLFCNYIESLVAYHRFYGGNER